MVCDCFLSTLQSRHLSGAGPRHSSSMHIVQPREDEAFPTYTIAALPSPEETHLKSARPTLCFPPIRVLNQPCKCHLLFDGPLPSIPRLSKLPRRGVCRASVECPRQACGQGRSSSPSRSSPTSRNKLISRNVRCRTSSKPLPPVPFLLEPV